jgi:hypothetical protein
MDFYAARPNPTIFTSSKKVQSPFDLETKKDNTVSVTKKRANVAKKKTRAKPVKGICAAAEALGVTRGHLWAVLTHRRESKPLIARYRVWKREQRKPLSTEIKTTR